MLRGHAIVGLSRLRLEQHLLIKPTHDVQCVQTRNSCFVRTLGACNQGLALQMLCVWIDVAPLLAMANLATGARVANPSTTQCGPACLRTGTSRNS